MWTSYLQWPFDGKTDAELEALLFPEKQATASIHRISEFGRIGKELIRY